jgi:hypothetical protein
MQLLGENTKPDKFQIIFLTFTSFPFFSGRTPRAQPRLPHPRPGHPYSDRPRAGPLPALHVRAQPDASPLHRSRFPDLKLLLIPEFLKNSKACLTFCLSKTNCTVNLIVIKKDFGICSKILLDAVFEVFANNER